MPEPPKFERKLWHALPPLCALLCASIAALSFYAHYWIDGTCESLVASAFAFQTWWIWYDIPRKWPYTETES